MSPAVQVGADEAPDRVDRLLARRLELPRSQVQKLLRDGKVRVGGRVVRASHAVEPGDTVEYEEPAPPPTGDLAAEEGELRVLHEDADLVVLDKPPFLTVHPGAGRREGTLAHRLIGRYPEMAGVGGPGRPGIVHRLDQGTSGVMVVARTSRAYHALAAAFASRAVRKTYLAIVWGPLREPAGTIELPIGRHPDRRTEMAVRPGGRPALTRWRRLAATGPVALVEVDLGTGRTHQIRVHLKAIGHPLVGDPVYGEARWRAAPKPAQAALRDFPRPALHAWRLAFAHPASGEAMRFEAPVPDDLRALWQAAGGGAWPVEVTERGAAG